METHERPHGHRQILTELCKDNASPSLCTNRDATQDERKVFWVAAGSAWECAKLQYGVGDCNAKIGQRRHGMEQAMEPRGSVTTLNDYVERVTMMCCTVGLSVRNAFFQHRKVHKTTWTSPNGKTTNEIDYLWINGRWSHHYSYIVIVKVKTTVVTNPDRLCDTHYSLGSNKKPRIECHN